jgi:hypothetical protein
VNAGCFEALSLPRDLAQLVADDDSVGSGSERAMMQICMFSGLLCVQPHGVVLHVVLLHVVSLQAAFLHVVSSHVAFLHVVPLHVGFWHLMRCPC